MHKIRGFSWVLAVLLLICCICMQASAVQGSDLCYQYTPQMTDNTFRYLDEIYISKYPAMGLRFRSGTDADRQRLQKLPSTGSNAEQPEDTTFPEKLQEQAFGISIGYTSEQKQYYSQLQLQVSELRDEAADSAVQLITKTAGEVRRSRVFDISLLNTEGVSVQPDGTILVTIPVPQNWAGEDLHVFYVDPKAGTTEDMGATLSQDGTHVRFTTDHFSCYTLVQLTPKNELPILWVSAGVAAVLLIAAGVLIFVKKKKAA